MTAPGRAPADVPVHRLRPNEAVWTPPSVIFLDTETCWDLDGTSEVHRLRLWVACHVDRRRPRKRAGPVCWGWGETAGDLADWLCRRTRGRDCVWLYAHNLNFDLATTNLAATMRARGWQVKDFSVSHGAPWLRLGRAGHTLTVVDSWAWLPEALSSLAAHQGRGKVALPDNAAGMGDWWQRCASDVDILARAVLDLMAWWDRERLGRWTISGAGSGWNAMRHVPTPYQFVIDVTPELVAVDRQAVRGGRKDAAVVRSHQGGPWVEIDLTAAYPTVARELPVPYKRAWTFDRLPVDSRWLDSDQFGIVAEAEVRTDRPRYPVRWSGVTWYPVGAFRTVLAGPELAWARTNGDLVHVGAGQAHRLAPILRPWAAWVLDPTREGAVEVPPAVAVACRAWGRSTLGKFAARGRNLEPLEGPAPDRWSITDMWDGFVGRRGAEVTMGGRAFHVTYDGDTENCYPAVLAWIESQVRVRLGRVLEALDGAWWTCDTDGLLVDVGVCHALLRARRIRLGTHARDPFGLAQAVCDTLAPLVAPLVLRPKRVMDSLAVLGPQHTVVGGQRKVSGVRAESVEVAPWKFVGRDWPKLKWQIQHSPPGVYTRPERTSTFRGPTVHRWVGDDGSAWPVEMRVGAGGVNELVPWPETRWAAAGVVLADEQYRLLQRVVL